MTLSGQERETAMAKAKLLYLQGEPVAHISRDLKVPVSSLKRWKAQGEWERGRKKGQDVTNRVRALFEEQLAHLESLSLEDRTTSEVDALKKLASLLESLEKIEKGRGTEGGDTSETRGLSDKAARDIRGRILGVTA